MGKRKYSDELKQQIIKECREIGNTALVARRHSISRNTVYSWLKKPEKMVLLKLFLKIKKNSLKNLKNALLN